MSLNPSRLHLSPLTACLDLRCRTLSFPDLGNGSTPVIMYGPECRKPAPPPPTAASRPHQLRARTGDAARIEVALPRDPHDPYLQDWVRVQPGPAKFGKAQMLS